MRRSETGPEVAGKRRRSVTAAFLWRAAVMAIVPLPATPFFAAGQHEASDQLEVEWDVVIPTGGAAVGNAVTELSDGSLAVAGYVRVEGGGAVGLVAVLESDGSLRWARRYGGSEASFLWDVEEAPDGGLVAVGFTGPGGAEDVWMLAVKEAGAPAWERRWGGAGRDRAWSLDLADRGGWVVAGERTAEHGGLDAWVLRVTQAGDTTWTRTLGGAGTQRVFSVAALEGGGAVVTGGTGSNDRGGGDNDMLIARIGRAGEVVWQKSLGGDRYDVGHGVIATPAAGPGGVLVTGYGTPEANESGDTDVMLLLLDEAGRTVWWRTHPGPVHERAMMSAPGPDGGWATVGLAVMEGQFRAWLSGSDDVGKERWRQIEGVEGARRGVMVTATGDGAYVWTGAAGTPIGQPEGLWVRKVRAIR